METAAQTIEGMASGSVGASVAAPPVLPPNAGKSKSTDEQRRLWREKGAMQRARARARETGAPLPPAPVALSPEPAEPIAPPRVPWSANVLNPLADRIIDAIEAAAIDSLKEAAAKVSPALVATVEKDAPWDTVSKTTLKQTAPEVAAKWLNKFGVDAENAPEVLLCTAAISVWFGHNKLLNKLKAMAAEQKKRDVPGDDEKENVVKLNAAT